MAGCGGGGGGGVGDDDVFGGVVTTTATAPGVDGPANGMAPRKMTAPPRMTGAGGGGTTTTLGGGAENHAGAAAARVMVESPASPASSPPRGRGVEGLDKIAHNAIGVHSQTSALLSGVQVVENLQLESAI